MSARLKMILVAAVVLIATVSAILWKTGALLYEDRMAFIADSSMKQIAPLKRLISEQLNTRKKELVHFAATRAVNGAGRSRAFGEFEVIALVEPDANGQWAPAWIERGASAQADRWPQGYDLTLLKSVAYKKAKDGEVLWMRLSDAKGTAMFAAAVPVQLKSAALSADPTEASALPDSMATQSASDLSARRGVVVGFTSSNPLVSSTEGFIGSMNSVFVVDDRGYVASHVDKNYTGALFTEDSIVKQILAANRVSGSGRFTDLDGRKVLGHFEKIADSNLYAVITTPMAAMTGLMDSYRNTVLVAALAAGILSMLLAWFVGGTLTSAAPVIRGFIAEEVNDENIETVFAAPVTAPIESVDKRSVLSFLNDEQLKNERKNAYEAFQKDFASRLREPLLAILGQAQLIKAKSDDESLTGHAGSIEREARLAKESLDRLQFLNEGPMLNSSHETADLEEAISGALADKALELQNFGIRIDSQTDALSVRGQTREIETALIHIIENSIEAMRDRSDRKLTITLNEVAGQAVLRVSDTGVGMTQDIRDHAFEPFFRGFESPRHMGLGLTFVQSTVRRWGGECSVESNPGEGTTIEIRFSEVVRVAPSDERVAVDPEPLIRSLLDQRMTIDEEIVAQMPPPPQMGVFAEADDVDQFEVVIRQPRTKGT